MHNESTHRYVRPSDLLKINIASTVIETITLKSIDLSEKLDLFRDLSAMRSEFINTKLAVNSRTGETYEWVKDNYAVALLSNFLSDDECEEGEAIAALVERYPEVFAKNAIRMRKSLTKKVVVALRKLITDYCRLHSIEGNEDGPFLAPEAQNEATVETVEPAVEPAEDTQANEAEVAVEPAEDKAIDVPAAPFLPEVKDTDDNWAMKMTFAIAEENAVNAAKLLLPVVSPADREFRSWLQACTGEDKVDVSELEMKLKGYVVVEADKSMMAEPASFMEAVCDRSFLTSNSSELSIGFGSHGYDSKTLMGTLIKAATRRALRMAMAVENIAPLNADPAIVDRVDTGLSIAWVLAPFESRMGSWTWGEYSESVYQLHLAYELGAEAMPGLHDILCRVEDAVVKSAGPVMRFDASYLDDARRIADTTPADVQLDRIETLADGKQYDINVLHRCKEDTARECLMDLIIERDVLLSRAAILREMVAPASHTPAAEQVELLMAEGEGESSRMGPAYLTTKAHMQALWNTFFSKGKAKPAVTV